jgi:hypothetical protein
VDYHGSGQGAVADSCECGHELSGSSTMELVNQYSTLSVFISKRFETSSVYVFISVWMLVGYIGFATVFD